MDNKHASQAVKMLTKNRGFTMIELIVVIAILGLLATIGLASFRTSQIKGRDAQRKSDLAQIQKALEMYLNDKQQYPLSIPIGGSSWQDEDESTTLYMKEVPRDPKFGDYIYTSDGNYYILYARLENEQDICFQNGFCKDYGIVCGQENCNYALASPNQTP